MCAPAVIPLAIGTAVGVASAVSQGSANAEQARVNAVLARRQAGHAKQVGAEKAGQIGAAGRRMSSSALAGQAKGGGSFSEVPMALTAANVAADQAQVRSNSAMSAWGFEAEAATWDAKRKYAKTSTGFGVAGALLGGAGGITSALTK